ncbi:glycosyltransferase family 2 protein [Salinimicrobium sp. CAU 1759]
MEIESESFAPLVSIVLPVFNGEQFLAKSIKSCLRQSHKNLELIIVNDGSSDKTLSIAEKFGKEDSRIKLITNAQNIKLPASLNAGHLLAKGEFLTWTSHDNIFEEKAVEVLLKELVDSRADIVYSNFTIIEAGGKFRKKFDLNTSPSLVFGNSIGASFLYRKDVFVRNNGYNEDFHSVEDYDFWLRASVHSKFHHIDHYLYNFRSHEKSLSSNLQRINSPENRAFNDKLKNVYSDFFHSLEINNCDDLADVFCRIHQYKQIDVSRILSKYHKLQNLLHILSAKIEFLSFKRMVEDFDIRARANINLYPENQTYQTFLSICANRPKLLLSYDKRNSINILWKCLKPFND